MRNNSKGRREERRQEAAERKATNTVVNCPPPCGNRHALGWAGCKAA